MRLINKSSVNMLSNSSTLFLFRTASRPVLLAEERDRQVQANWDASQGCLTDALMTARKTVGRAPSLPLPVPPKKSRGSPEALRAHKETDASLSSGLKYFPPLQET